jgi:predicted phage terminase large subunit-like protein
MTVKAPVYELKYYSQEHYQVASKIQQIIANHQENSKILKEEELWELWQRFMDYLIWEAQRDFYVFVKLVGPTHINGFVAGRHINKLARHLQQMEEGVALKDPETKGKMVHMPPGGSKSKVSSNLFPAWAMGRNPNWFILLVGHTIKFAEDNLGRPTKDVMNYPQYKAIFPNIAMRKDVDSAGRFYTEQGGQIVATGVGSNIAGRRAHLALLDDPVSEQTTTAEKAEMLTWFYDGLRTRLMPEGRVGLIMTRWGTDDIAGELKKKNAQDWDTISFPAILDAISSAILGLPVGSSYWPEFWPLKRFLALKQDMPAQRYSALYMQSPVPEEGTIFKKDNFQIWPHSEPPQCDFILVSLDTAYGGKQGKNDPTAWGVWGVFQRPSVNFEGREVWVNHLILLECGKNWYEPGDLINLCKDLRNDYKPDLFLIEKQASGNFIGQELRKRGIPTLDFVTKHDKIARAQACQVIFQNRRVWFPDKDDEVNDLMNECLEFPYGKHDDAVDQLTQALLWMKDIYDISRDVSADGEGFLTEEEEDDAHSRYQSKSYWSKVSFSVR